VGELSNLHQREEKLLSEVCVLAVARSSLHYLLQSCRPNNMVSMCEPLVSYHKSLLLGTYCFRKWLKFQNHTSNLPFNYAFYFSWDLFMKIMRIEDSVFVK